MFDKIKKLFRKKVPVNIEDFEAKWPVGTWFKSGNGLVRLSNVYEKDGELLITIEKPVPSGGAFTASERLTTSFIIEKEDDLSPSYLNGWIRVADKESEKLERSYWKTIEKDLQSRTKSMENFYRDFVKIGSK